MTTEPKPDFKAADFDGMGEAPQPGIVAEFADFLRYNKKWWLLPILIVIGLFGLAALLLATPAAPFIYTLF